MPLTKENMTKVNALVKEGRVDAARVLLESLDGEKAIAALQKLNERYPPIDDIAEAKQLIAQKKYDEAEALLWASKSPEAADLLKKLTLVRSVQPRTTSPSTPGTVPTSGFQVKAKSRPTNHRVRNLSLFTAVCILAGFVVWLVALQQQGAGAGRDLTLFFSVEDICHRVFKDDYLMSTTSTQYINGCKSASRHLLDDYTATVSRCYDAWSDEEYKMTECLVDGGAQFEEIWFVAGMDGD